VHYAAVASGDFAAVSETVPELLGRPARSLAAFAAEDPGRFAPPAPTRQT